MSLAPSHTQKPAKRFDQHYQPPPPPPIQPLSREREGAHAGLSHSSRNSREVISGGLVDLVPRLQLTWPNHRPALSN